MACSKYASTRQTTHAARMSRLLCGPCTDILRDVLRQHIPETSFPATLQKRKVKGKLLSLRNLQTSQRELLYPQVGTFTGTYNDFDISLLYIFLRNTTKITQHVKGWGCPPDDTDRSISANIDRIRMIRNQIGAHCHRHDLSDAVFSTSWAKLKRSVVELVRGTGISTNYEQCINDLVNEPMDPDREDYWLECLQKQIKEDAERYKEIEKKVERNEKRIEYIEKIFQETSKEAQNQEAKNILDNTEAVLQNHKSSTTYVRTGQVETVKQKLFEQHFVLLTGRPGDGKSTIAKQVLCELSEDNEYIPVILTEPCQWNKVVNANQNMAIYIDDMFGASNVDANAIQKWKKLFDIMMSSANKGKISVLISSRRNIIADIRKTCHVRFLNPEYEIDLVSKVVTSKEKISILLRYETVHVYRLNELIGGKFRSYEELHGKDAVYKLSGWEKEMIVNSEPYYGFPQTCFLFFSRKDFFQLGTDFFLRSNKTLFENIDDMRKSTDVRTKMQYCTLAYVFLEGNIHLRDLKEDIFQEICEKSSLPKWTDVDVEDAIQDLEGIYLSPGNQMQVFKFCHVTIREAVAASFGKIAPDIVIQKSSMNIIRELIRTEGYKARDGEVILTIRKKVYPLLANRLLTEDTEYHFYPLALNHPAADDPEFTPVLFDMINKLSHNSRTTIKKIWDALEYKDKPILYKEILTGHGPHHIKHKAEYDSDMSVDERDSDTSVEPPYLITREKVKDRLDGHLYMGHKQSAIIIIRYVISKCDVNYFLNSYCSLSCHIRGMSVLHHCVAQGLTDVVDEMLNVVIPTKTENEWSCLHFAAFFGRFELFKKFEKLSSNVLETTREGYNILQVVLLGLTHGMHESLDVYFLSASDTSDNYVCFRYISECETDFINIVQHVITRYPSLITSMDMPLDNHNNNIIHYLVIHDRVEIYDTVVQKKKDLLFHRNDTNLPSTLHMAAYLGRTKFVERLWMAGVRARETDISIAESIESGKEFNGQTTYVGRWRDEEYHNIDNFSLRYIRDQSVRHGSSEDYIAITSICIPGI